MTAQRDDYIIWNRSKYSIVSLTLNGYGELFDPYMYGLKPVMMSTGCYRGYYCNYKIVKDNFQLNELTVRTKEKKYPEINGVSPKVSEYGDAVYSDLHLPISVTGSIRIASGFIRSRYEHMGFQEATSYKTVKQMHFKDGKLLGVDDESNEVKLLRAAHAEVEKFKKSNWMNLEWEARLKDSYAYIDDDIGRTFERRLQPLDSSNVIKTMEEIKNEQAIPLWFIHNYEDYYEQAHKYHFELNFLAFLGCPFRILDFLHNLISSKHSEQQVVVAFIETLRTTIIGDLWGETLNIITGKQFVLANVDPSLKQAIENHFSGTTLESWQLCS